MNEPGPGANDYGGHARVKHQTRLNRLGKVRPWALRRRVWGMRTSVVWVLVGEADWQSGGLNIQAPHPYSSFFEK